jgi:hypothetical protein
MNTWPNLLIPQRSPVRWPRSPPIATGNEPSLLIAIVDRIGRL